MSILDFLFGNRQTGQTGILGPSQPATHPATPLPAGVMTPPSPNPDYDQWYQSRMQGIQGPPGAVSTDRIDADRRLAATIFQETAPQEWQKYQAERAQLMAPQLNVGQALELLNRYRQQQGSAPVDPSNILGNQPSPNAAPAPQAPPNGMLPTGGDPSANVLPPYDPYYKAYSDNAFLRSLASSGFWGHGALGGILKAVSDKNDVPLTAPATYMAQQGAEQGVQGGAVDLNTKRLAFLQNLALMQRAGLDPSMFLHAVNSGGAAPSAAAPYGAAPSANPIPYVPGAGPGPTQAAAAALPPGGAAAVATPGGNFLPPTADATSRALSQFLSYRATPPAAPPAAAPVRPIAGPQAPAAGIAAPTNPADAVRAHFAQLAQLYSGLPAYSSQALEYEKMAQTGALPNTIADPVTGRMVDAVTGQPISTDASTYLAQRAGLTAGAEASARLPYEEAASGYDAAAHGQQQRQTDAARIYGEAATAAPITMRAPDGSIVAVSRAQLPELAASGNLGGYRPLTPEDEKAFGALGEQYAKDQASLADARKLQQTVAVMQDQARAFQPGTWGDLRATGARFLTGLGFDGNALASTLGNPASADVMAKDTLRLAMQQLRDSFGGQREAGFIVEKAMNANPNIQTQDEAYRFMTNVIGQEAARQADYITGQEAYRAKHGTIAGFPEQFDRTNPVANYTNQAYADTYGAPAGSKFLGRHQGHPVFQGADGRKFAIGGQ
ncbi:MAG TPA: hypothetical protein VKS60_11435 [Stellaceae bacterium]|nr:hypothetical protein [Stellaceae bacterium]